MLLWNTKHNSLAHRAHSAFGKIAQKIPGKLAWVLFVNTRPRTVVCERCKGMFPSVFSLTLDGSKQGDNCATVCNNGRITCHYGSSLDGNVYVGTIPDMDPICDDCVKELSDNGKIKLIGNFLFGASSSIG